MSNFHDLRMVGNGQMAHVRTALGLGWEIEQGGKVAESVRLEIHLALAGLLEQLRRDFKVKMDRDLHWVPEEEPLTPVSVDLLNDLTAKLGRVRQNFEHSEMRVAAR